ncbi:hypothetical protein TSH100_08390 [Azospirillum sp. TSH100]|uniref:PqqD family protein n=1 Tax=Azospirillum sp. TSH100 TaxID=652764 RepID=UPI000D606792|nr:PqqD family protein [Azospirillum sp. TSH100]PWC88154.1 hypothetical protein TSH100_08390 [Azospirillum sp. TSH100]QCG92164.1 PqqD family protein [Azospirillum sp. TSH100]
MIQLSSVVSINADLLSTEIEGEFVMMDMDSGRYFNLDRIGSVIWKTLEQPREVADLCRFLGEHYEAPAEVIERDVLDLLQQMADRKLIRLHD